MRTTGTQVSGLLLLIGLAGLTILLLTAPLVLAQSAPVLASAQYANDPDLRCDLLEVKRASGGSLMIRWRVVNTTGQSGGLTGTSGKTISHDWGWELLYFIDPAENKKYQFLTDSAGNRIVDVFSGAVKPGEQRLSWARFPAPPAASTKISFSIPKCSPPLEDIPVSQ